MYYTWMEIDLDIIARNYKKIKEKLSGNAEVIAVVKADAYGLGAAPIALKLQEAGCEFFAVTFLEEAIALRNVGIHRDILVMMPIELDEVKTAFEQNLVVALADKVQAKSLSEKAVSENMRLKAHIKLDCGLSRLGIVLKDRRDAAASDTEDILNLPGIEASGIFTHITSASIALERKEPDIQELERFTYIADKIAEKGYRLKRHILCTGPLPCFQEYMRDYIRIGSLLYGLRPGSYGDYDMKNCMTMKTRVIQVKTIPAGTEVSYGPLYTTSRETRIAIVPIGFADGLRRALSNVGEMLIKGVRVPIIGKICCDHTILDVTDVKDVVVGDVVTIFGKDGEIFQSAGDYSRIYAASDPETTTILASRIKRIYLNISKEVHVMDVKRKSEEYKEYAVALRREFHKIPEISTKEYKTSARIMQELDSLGISYSQIADTGILGVIQGHEQGKTVALRADIDGLAVTEETGLPYSSTNPGVMHACGHDGHIAALLMAAKILQECRDSWNGTVKLLFQPAEERWPGGADRMVQDGAMDGVDTAFGLHLWSEIDTGLVSAESGPVMSSSAELHIKITGKSSHGALPHQGVDAVLVGSAIVMNLQAVVSRMNNAQKPAVISVDTFNAGVNIIAIAPEATLTGTVRFFNTEQGIWLGEQIKRVVNDTAGMYGASATVEYITGYRVVNNDPKVSEQIRAIAKRLYGEKSVVSHPKQMTTEDFSAYAALAPSCYAFVGCHNPNDPERYALHHSKFSIDEDSLPVAASLHVQFALDYLGASYDMDREKEESGWMSW